MSEQDEVVSCGYTGKHFGAHYPDAVCIEGFLWDLDSCDEPGGPLFEGGEIPCPNCAVDDWVTYLAEDVKDLGARAFEDGQPVSSPPDFIFAKARLVKLWEQGWQEEKIERDADHE